MLDCRRRRYEDENNQKVWFPARKWKILWDVSKLVKFVGVNSTEVVVTPSQALASAFNDVELKGGLQPIATAVQTNKLDAAFV